MGGVESALPPSPVSSSLSARGEEVFTVKDYASRAVVEVEWLDAHHGVTFPKFGDQNSISRATVAVSTANAQHGILLIFLDNASGHKEEYILLTQNEYVIYVDSDVYHLRGGWKGWIFWVGCLTRNMFLWIKKLSNLPVLC